MHESIFVKNNNDIVSVLDKLCVCHIKTQIIIIPTIYRLEPYSQLNSRILKYDYLNTTFVVCITIHHVLEI